MKKIDALIMLLLISFSFGSAWCALTYHQESAGLVGLALFVAASVWQELLQKRAALEQSKSLTYYTWKRGK